MFLLILWIVVFIFICVFIPDKTKAQKVVRYAAFALWLAPLVWFFVFGVVDCFKKGHTDTAVIFLVSLPLGLLAGYHIDKAATRFFNRVFGVK